MPRNPPACAVHGEHLTGAAWFAMIAFVMVLQPQTVEELQQAVAAANASGERIASVRVDALNHLVDHVPEDMTATVEAGMTLSEFQQRLASQGQWLPVDPPGAERLGIGELLSANASGPRRFGYGTVRDYLIGMKVVLADGRAIKSGGKVVKNVAGYDLCKLFIGAHGTLGVIVEATFKLRPLPEAEQFVQAQFGVIEKTDAFLQAVLESDLVPMVLDLHNLPVSPPLDPSQEGNLPKAVSNEIPSWEGSGVGPRPERSSERTREPRANAPRAHALTIVLGFAGAREDVEYQLNQGAKLGAKSASNLSHETEFWRSTSTAPIRRISVAPSRLVETVQGLGDVPFVARAGNGLICYRGGSQPPKAETPEKLIRRVKDTFDPKHIFPELPL